MVGGGLTYKSPRPAGAAAKSASEDRAAAAVAFEAGRPRRRPASSNMGERRYLIWDSPGVPHQGDGTGNEGRRAQGG